MARELEKRPVLIGMNNPLSSDPRYALFPYPVGCSGWRIWKLLCTKVDVTKGEYLRAFDRRNLVVGKKWRFADAVREARNLQSALVGRNVVIFGREPRVAFGLPEKLIHPIKVDGVTFRQAPHPSGRNLWYNDRTQAELVALMLESLYVEWAGGYDALDKRSKRVRGSVDGSSIAPEQGSGRGEQSGEGESDPDSSDDGDEMPAAASSVQRPPRR